MGKEWRRGGGKSAICTPNPTPGRGADLWEPGMAERGWSPGRRLHAGLLTAAPVLVTRKGVACCVGDAEE